MKKLINQIIENAIRDTNPYTTVVNELKDRQFIGKVYVFAVGKAAADMAKGCYDALNGRQEIAAGLVVTKYGHAKEISPLFTVIESGHPVPDENSEKATEKFVEIAENITERDTVIALVSGGASALFEKSLIDREKMQALTSKMLKSGMTINEMNTVRKHLSVVKGGNFIQRCNTKNILALVLSDVIGDDLSVIGSGLTVLDKTTKEDAIDILQRYGIEPPVEISETPKNISDVENILIGNLTILCNSAKNTAKSNGYKAKILSTEVQGEAREIAKQLVELAKNEAENTVLIMGGETTVTVKGKGLGGRNQEFALAAGIELENVPDVTVFAFGSDGTDGPTDAAGGIADCNTAGEIYRATGKSATDFLENNDAYHALKSVDRLIITGPTGTNVNDIYVAIKKSGR